jgi:hypothetical protein
MRASWPGLLLAPLFALVDQSVTYAMVEWSCETQRHALPHAVHLIFLLLTLATLWMAQGNPPRAGVREDSGDPATARSFVSTLAMLVGALSALVIVAMWVPQWMLSPCHG